MREKYHKIVFLTGAGISAESGLATFRSENGLWNNHRVEDVATIEAYYRNQDYVHDFYNNMKPELWNAKPNAGHLAITNYNRNIRQTCTSSRKMWIRCTKRPKAKMCTTYTGGLTKRYV